MPLAAFSLQAIAINSGTLSITNPGANIGFVNGPNFLDFAIGFDGFNNFSPIDTCNTTGAPCTFNFNSSQNNTVQGFAIVRYNGTPYFSLAGNNLSLSMTLVGGTSTVSAVDVGTFYHYEVSVPFTMTGVATFASGGSPVFTSLPLSGSGIASAYVDVSKAGFVFGSQKTYTFAPTPEPASFALAGIGLAFFFLRKRVQN